MSRGILRRCTPESQTKKKKRVAGCSASTNQEGEINLGGETKGCKWLSRKKWKKKLLMNPELHNLKSHPRGSWQEGVNMFLFPGHCCVYVLFSFWRDVLLENRFFTGFNCSRLWTRWNLIRKRFTVVNLWRGSRAGIRKRQALINSHGLWGLQVLVKVMILVGPPRRERKAGIKL